MALGTPVLRLSDAQNSAGQTSFTTSATMAPVANTLHTVFVFFRDGAGISTNPTLTGNGITWSVVRRVTTGAGVGKVCVVFSGSAASPSSGALTVARGGSDTWDQCVVRAVEHVGAASIASSAEVLGDFDFTITATLTVDPGGFCYAAKWSVQDSATARSGWTELFDNNYTGSPSDWCIEAQYRNSSDTAAAVTWANEPGISALVVMDLVESASGIGIPKAMRYYNQQRE